MAFKCVNVFTDQEVKDLLKESEELLRKYEKFKIQKELEKDPLIKWCPRPGCERYVKADSIKASKV